MDKFGYFFSCFVAWNMIGWAFFLVSEYLYPYHLLGSIGRFMLEVSLIIYLVLVALGVVAYLLAMKDVKKEVKKEGIWFSINMNDPCAPKLTLESLPFDWNLYSQDSPE